MAESVQHGLGCAWSVRAGNASRCEERPLSDVPQGDGWWVASDGRWYPPHLHPDVAADDAAASPPPASDPATDHGTTKEGAEPTGDAPATSEAAPTAVDDPGAELGDPGTPEAQPPAPGWWQASDGNWYAPELHPAYQGPTPVAAEHSNSDDWFAAGAPTLQEFAPSGSTSPPFQSGEYPTPAPYGASGYPAPPGTPPYPGAPAGYGTPYAAPPPDSWSQSKPRRRALLIALLVVALLFGGGAGTYFLLSGSSVNTAQDKANVHKLLVELSDLPVGYVVSDQSGQGSSGSGSASQQNNEFLASHPACKQMDAFTEQAVPGMADPEAEGTSSFTDGAVGSYESVQSQADVFSSTAEGSTASRTAASFTTAVGLKCTSEAFVAGLEEAAPGVTATFHTKSIPVTTGDPTQAVVIEGQGTMTNNGVTSSTTLVAAFVQVGRSFMSVTVTTLGAPPAQLNLLRTLVAQVTARARAAGY